MLAEQAVAELTGNKGGAVWARRGARPAPYIDSLRADLEAADHCVAVGEVVGAVVGYAVVRAESLRDGGVLGVLDDIYVEPEAREVGVGEALMDAVEAWAAATRLHRDRLARAAGQPRDEELLRDASVWSHARSSVHRPLDGD